MLILLAFWALAGLGCGILFADTLNEINIEGFRSVFGLPSKAVS